MAITFAMGMVATVTACNDSDTDLLTCSLVTSPDNCWRTVATRAFECMDRGSDEYLVRGTFDATGTTCTDELDATRTATFDPSKPTDSLVGNWWTGSFTLSNGASECGTIGFDSFEGRSALTISVDGDVAIAVSSPYELVCPDGTRFSAAGGDLRVCWTSFPSVTGAVNFQTNGNVTIHPHGQPTINCTLPAP